MRAFATALAALGLLGPALADETGQIRVVGRAQEQRAPDFAAVELGIVSRAPSPAAALDAASKAAGSVIAGAKAMGVPDAEIGTAAVTLEPQSKDVRQPDGSILQKDDGYAASNRITVRLFDIPKLGELTRKALDGGANRVDGLSFGLRDPAAAEAAIQVAAMQDARAQAERLAGAAGVRLGPALSISAPPRSDGGAPMPYAMRAKAAPPRGAAVPIEAGSITLSAEVEAVFAIER